MPDIRNELSSITLLDGQTYFFNDEVARLGIGSPLKATTASEMTDITKIYVYVGEETGYDFGHWYYNNGTAWIDGGVYNSIAVQTDKSLSVPNEPADAFETGENIRDLKSAINEYNSYNILQKYLPQSKTDTSAGVTFTWSNGVCSTSGTSSGDALTRIFWVNRYTMPDGMKAGKWYHFEYNTNNPNIRLSFILYKNGEVYRILSFSTSGDVEIEDGVEGVQVRLYVSNGLSAADGSVTKISVISEKTNSDISSNVNGKLLSFGNSIMTGTVFVNGVRDHRSSFDNAPYGCVARSLGIPQKNVTHIIHADTGFVTGPTTNFLDEIEDTDLTGYDYLLTQFHYSDLNSSSYSLGNIDSTAGDGTFVGAVLELMQYITANNPQCQLILIASPPVMYQYTWDNYYSHVFECGSTPDQIDNMMCALAVREKFIYADWRDSSFMPYYQDYADGDNYHANNEMAYRVMGDYLGRKIFNGVEVTRSPHLPNNSDLDLVLDEYGSYYLSSEKTYVHAPNITANSFLYSFINQNEGRRVQLIFTAAHDFYYRSYAYPNWTAWEKVNKTEPYTQSGKFVELHDTARIKAITGNSGNVVVSNKNLFHLVPASASSNGIEWAEKTDGTISFHGTSTAKASFNLLNRNTQPLPMYDVFYTVSSGRYGDKYGSTDIGYALYVSEYDEENTWLRQVQDVGDGVTFYAVPGRKYAIDFKIESGITASDLRFAFQIEVGEKRTGFVKHQGMSFAIGNAASIALYDGINVLYSENTDSDITVSYTDIERAEPNVKDDLLFSISDPAQGTETEDPGVVFNRIKDTAVENSYKLLCDYRSYDTSNMSVFTEEFGFGVRQYSSGQNRLFGANSQVSTLGNYICVPIIVENLDNLDVVKFSIQDTTNKYVVFDIKDGLREGINWFITNMYFATTVNSGFNKNSIAYINVRTQAKENRAASVTWGVFHTYDFRPMCTYIFDDGLSSQYSYNYQKMKEYGYQAVYAVPTKNLFDGGQYHLTAEQAKIMAADGCDIISHTRDHVNLIGLTMAQQKYQMQKAREALIQTVPGRNAYYFAPPNVNMTNNTRYHERAISVMNKNATVIKRNDDKFTLLPNLNPLETFCWGTNNAEYPVVHPNRVFTPAQMKEKIDIAIQYGLWVQFGMHYFVDNASQYYDRDGWLKSDFENVLDYLADHSADIDVVTYRQAYDKM